MNKPYADSCDRNRDPILGVILPLLTNKPSVLEIGSGTGQHALYFSEKIPNIAWHASDRLENHPAIHSWLAEAANDNVFGPLELDVSSSAWPATTYDAVFSANTAHIMHWENVVDMFAGVGRVLDTDGLFLLYGPFTFNGMFTSVSNYQFDQRLRSRDPKSGIRNFEDLDGLANKAGLKFIDRYDLPANNHILCWQKS